jgi:hypothetical protein
MPQATLTRSYSAKDAVMLTALSVILKNAEDNLTELTAENDNWNATLVSTLKARVDKDFTDILGIDPKKDQRAATATVKAIQIAALPLLSTVSLRMGVAIKDAVRRTELLNQLGFTAFAKKAQAKDQIALIELLAQFKTNLTVEVKAEITASKDIKATVIDSIIGYANTFSNENITQETYKSNSKNITAEGVAALNATYTAVVTEFAKLVQDFYKKKKSAKKDLFSFSAIKKAVQNSGNGGTPPPQPTTPK